MLSRKYYRGLANVLKSHVDVNRCVSDDVAVATIRVCVSVADWLADDNPRFNRKKFMRACGIEEVTV
jgi:hypothetical protein